MASAARRGPGVGSWLFRLRHRAGLGHVAGGSRRFDRQHRTLAGAEHLHATGAIRPVIVGHSIGGTIVQHC
jgi:hypothetical protein